MYSHRNFIYLITILECIEKITIYTHPFEQVDEFTEANDQMNYNASCALLLVIGEEAKKLSKELKAEYSKIPWSSISATRNFLAHEYRELNRQPVFDIIRQELPLLKSVIINMFDKVDYSKEALSIALLSPYYRHVQYLREKLND